MNIFADHSRLTQAASRLAKAQARFDVVVKQVQLIMKPLHDELQSANEAFKAICTQTAKDEAAHISVDLVGLLQVAQQAIDTKPLTESDRPAA